MLKPLLIAVAIAVSGGFGVYSAPSDVSLEPDTSSQSTVSVNGSTDSGLYVGLSANGSVDADAESDLVVRNIVGK